MSAPSRAPVSRAARELRSLRRAFVVILGLWLAVPLLEFGSPAQDAVVMVTAGSLALDDPDLVYLENDSLNVTPEFAERFCEAYDSRRDCEPEITPFTNPPMSLPLLALLSKVDIDVASLLFRAAAAIALVLTFELMWRTLAPDRTTAAWLLVVTILCTPVVVLTIQLGQNSSFLVLTAVAGMTGVAGARVEPVASALVTIFKGFPLAAIAVWSVFERRVRELAVLVGAITVLTLLAVALFGLNIIGDFVDGTRSISQGTGYPHDTSLEAMISRVAGDTVDVPAAWMIRLLLLGLALRVLRQSRTPDERWVLAILFLTYALPKVWPHYLLLVVPAYVVIERARNHPVDLRLLAVPCLGIAVVGLLNNHAAELLPWAQPPTLVAIGAILAVAWRRPAVTATNA